MPTLTCGPLLTSGVLLVHLHLMVKLIPTSTSPMVYQAAGQNQCYIRDLAFNNMLNDHSEQGVLKYLCIHKTFGILLISLTPYYNIYILHYNKIIFQTVEDPLEQRDLFDSRPDIVRRLLSKIDKFKQLSVQNVFQTPIGVTPQTTTSFGIYTVPRFDFCTPSIDFPLRPRNASCNSN